MVKIDAHMKAESISRNTNSASTEPAMVEALAGHNGKFSNISF